MFLRLRSETGCLCCVEKFFSTFLKFYSSIYQSFTSQDRLLRLRSKAGLEMLWSLCQKGDQGETIGKRTSYFNPEPYLSHHVRLIPDS